MKILDPAFYTPLFNLLMKILASILVFIGLLDLLLKVIEVLEMKLGFEYSYWEQMPAVDNFLVIVGFIVGILWHYYAQQRGKISANLSYLSQALIRFWLAFMIAGYGFAKVLKTQFQVPEYIKDIPMGEQHPFWLTWNYFGFSREYALLLAAVEVGGSILLLFRRTRLLGASILFPAMANIVLINKYYYISPAAYTAALFFTLGLAYLLLLDFEKIKTCFFSLGQEFTRYNFTGSILKNILRVATLSLSFGLIWLYANDHTPNTTFLKGVWLVDSLKYNKEPALQPNASDSLLSRLYFEHKRGGETILEYNSHHRREYTHYRLSENEDSLYLRTDQRTLPFKIYKSEGKKLELGGIYGGDTISIHLKKIREPSY